MPVVGKIRCRAVGAEKTACRVALKSRFRGSRVSSLKEVRWMAERQPVREMSPMFGSRISFHGTLPK